MPIIEAFRIRFALRRIIRCDNIHGASLRGVRAGMTCRPTPPVRSLGSGWEVGTGAVMIGASGKRLRLNEFIGGRDRSEFWTAAAERILITLSIYR